MLEIKKNILKALIEYLKKKGYTEFRSELKGSETPKKLVSDSNKTYHPDLVVLHKDSKHLFSIEISDSINKTELIEKCHTMSNNAEKHNGKFHLVVPLENYDKVLQIINNNKLENVGIVQIRMN